MTYDPTTGGHAPGHLREWLLAYLDPDEHPLDDADLLRRPTLWRLTGLMWNCTDILPGRCGPDLLDWWCTDRECRRCVRRERHGEPRVDTYGQLARFVRGHLRERATVSA